MINPNDYIAEAFHPEKAPMNIMNADAKDVAEYLGCSPARVNELRKQTAKLVEEAAANGEDGFVLVWKVWVKQAQIIVKHKTYKKGEIYSCPLRSVSITHKQTVTFALPYGYKGTKAEPKLPESQPIGTWTFMDIK